MSLNNYWGKSTNIFRHFTSCWTIAIGENGFKREMLLIFVVSHAWGGEKIHVFPQTRNMSLSSSWEQQNSSSNLRRLAASIPTTNKQEGVARVATAVRLTEQLNPNLEITSTFFCVCVHAAAVENLQSWLRPLT